MGDRVITPELIDKMIENVKNATGVRIIDAPECEYTLCDKCWHIYKRELGKCDRCKAEKK